MKGEIIKPVFLTALIIRDEMDTSWIQVGEQIELEIKKQGINGEGIGYHNKLAVFVPGAITKEVVRCTIKEVFPKYANAEVNEIIQPSNRRTTPPCIYYDRCGGCQMQHIDYLEQLKIKQSILKQSFRRYTDLDVDQLQIERTIGQKPGFHYRNKSQMPFRNTVHGLELGLFKPGSNHFVTIKNCIVQEEAINQVNQLVLKCCKEENLLAYDTMHREGILLHLVTRVFASTNQIQVTLIATKKSPIFPKIAVKIMELDKRIKSVHLSINTPNSVQIFGNTTLKLAGQDTISEDIEGYSIHVSPEAFHQLNTEQMKQMYQAVIRIASFKTTDTVIDAFCGIGITSLMIAKHVRRVVGIDYSEASIEDANKNAKTNHVANVRFISDQVERAIPQIIVHNGRPDVIVFDPPRSGLDDSTIQLLRKTKIPKIIYISCNPSTLSKNIGALLDLYQIEVIQPLDMFPHTASVESITLLQLKG